MLNTDQLQDQLSALAQAHGLSRWDMGASCSTDLSVQVDRGKAHQLKGAQRSAVTVRVWNSDCLLYTSPSPRDSNLSRMPSSA